jgi:hypothetical protein
MNITTNSWDFETFPRPGTVAVTLEPKLGHSDQEIMNALADAGASKIVRIAPGFIAADADTDKLTNFSSIAHVHINPELHYARR